MQKRDHHVLSDAELAEVRRLYRRKGIWRTTPFRILLGLCLATILWRWVPLDAVFQFSAGPVHVPRPVSVRYLGQGVLLTLLLVFEIRFIIDYIWGYGLAEADDHLPLDTAELAELADIANELRGVKRWCEDAVARGATFRLRDLRAAERALEDSRRLDRDAIMARLGGAGRT